MKNLYRTYDRSDKDSPKRFFLWRRSGDFINFSAPRVGDTVNDVRLANEKVVFRNLCLIAVVCVFAVEIENLVL